MAIGRPTFRPCFRDKLLLSIIDGEIPQAEKGVRRQRNRENRLYAAKRALFGERRRTKKFNDLPALEFMARQYHRDHCVGFIGGRIQHPKTFRSVRQLAAEAAQKVFGNAQESTVQRLRTRFRGKRKRELVDIVRYEDEVDDSIDLQVLEQLQKLLQPYGIIMNLEMAGQLPVHVRQRSRSGGMR